MVARADRYRCNHGANRMTAPRYSVVIPTFRRGEALAECLETLCAVAYPLEDVEVIIVDNGGAEHSRAAADPFMNRLRIRYLINPINRGATDSR